jgi:hypothetical protein
VVTKRKGYKQSKRKEGDRSRSLQSRRDDESKKRNARIRAEERAEKEERNGR